jgi:hypothetical protein
MLRLNGGKTIMREMALIATNIFNSQHNLGCDIQPEYHSIDDAHDDIDDDHFYEGDPLSLKCLTQKYDYRCEPGDAGGVDPAHNNLFTVRCPGIVCSMGMNNCWARTTFPSINNAPQGSNGTRRATIRTVSTLSSHNYTNSIKPCTFVKPC